MAARRLFGFLNTLVKLCFPLLLLTPFLASAADTRTATLTASTTASHSTSHSLSETATPTPTASVVQTGTATATESLAAETQCDRSGFPVGNNSLVLRGLPPSTETQSVEVHACHMMCSGCVGVRDNDVVAFTTAALPSPTYPHASYTVNVDLHTTVKNATHHILAVPVHLSAGSYTMHYWSAHTRFHEGKRIDPASGTLHTHHDSNLAWRAGGTATVVCEEHCIDSVSFDGSVQLACSTEC